MRSMGFVDFLSHLCGDEAKTWTFSPQKTFLSHLCGDEVERTSSNVGVMFLSHLCGDEEIILP